jgi:hypothetical protein
MVAAAATATGVPLTPHTSVHHPPHAAPSVHSDTVLDSPVLATLMHMAVEAAVLRERAPVAEGLAFLQHLLTAWERVRGQQPGGRDAAGAHQQATEEAAEATRREARLAQAQACLAARGPRLLEALLLALLDTAPRQQLRAVSGCLHSMLCSDMYRDAAVQWMTPVLQRQNLPGGCWAAGLPGMSCHVRAGAPGAVACACRHCLIAVDLFSMFHLH